MPEYLAPGVYVEEVSFRSKSIEGVSTTTTGFVGPTRYGPILDPPPDILTSLQEFEATYGDGEQLLLGGDYIDNYMWHAVRAFFTEGGKRLYVKRIYAGTERDNPEQDQGGVATTTALAPLTLDARYPGIYGNFHVRFTPQVGQNALADQNGPTVRGLSDRDVVIVSLGGSTPSTSLAIAESYIHPVTGLRTWRFREQATPGSPIELSSLLPGTDEIQVVTLTVSVGQTEPGAIPSVWAGLPVDPSHELGGAPDSMGAVFDPDSITAQSTPIVVTYPKTLDGMWDMTGVHLLQSLHAHAVADSPPTTVEEWVLDPNLTVDQRSIDVILSGGSDGEIPSDTYYAGVQTQTDQKTGLLAFEDLDDISIVATPGAMFNYNADQLEAHAKINALITHAEKMRYRIAVVDCGPSMAVADVRAMRAQHDTSWAAIYYPWIEIIDPRTNQENHMPPSGFVAGIYARNDTNRAVYKAPANEVVNLAVAFEKRINKGQQEVLNPEGINCFRFFEDRGYRLWGARTMSSDTEWQYVNLRRYFAYLEHSIDKGTQWAVFEPNGDVLWASVRRSIDEFLLNEWTNHALLGDKPEQAYFVRCDRSTMTQQDLDSGRLVCLIGVAPLRPAEFVIFRIGQWTADAKH
jgi:uncharacterized protein